MSFQFLPFFTGDYLRDTRHLSCSEHGIYCLFLMACWDSRGPLSLDERRLQGICNARSGDEIEAMRRVLTEFFVLMEDGWYNLRMLREIEKADGVSRRRGAAGKAGAAAKMAKRSLQASQMLSKCLPNATGGEGLQEPISPAELPISPADLPITAYSALQDKQMRVHHTPTTTTTEKQVYGASALLVPASAGPDPIPPEQEKPEAVEPRPKPEHVPYQAIVDLYHSMLPSAPRIIRLTTARKSQIKARWSDVLDNLNEWRDYFAAVSSCPFLVGKVDPTPGRRRFVADLEWLTRESNFVKVVEGRYRG